MGGAGSTRISNIWPKRNIFCTISSIKKLVDSEISRCIDFPYDCRKKLLTASSHHFCPRRSQQLNLSQNTKVQPWPLSHLPFVYATVQAHIKSTLSAIAFSSKVKNLVDNSAAFLIKRQVVGFGKKTSKAARLKPIKISPLHNMLQSLHNFLTNQYDLALYKAMFLLAYHTYVSVHTLPLSPTCIASAVVPISTMIHLQQKI